MREIRKFFRIPIFLLILALLGWGLPQIGKLLPN